MGQVEENADLLAMGTAAGTVLIYSTAKGALHCTLVSWSFNPQELWLARVVILTLKRQITLQNQM